MVHNITGIEVSVTHSTIIDLNTQPDGVYFITIVTNKGVGTKKVMVAR
jgi:hypothetical protein